jgi:ATP-dependent Clp protease adaptor protein ClpS
MRKLETSLILPRQRGRDSRDPRSAQDDNFVMGAWQLEIGNATQRFELRAAYVSIFFMSAEPLAAEVAVPLVSINVRPRSAAPSTIGTPTIEKETREEEALDVPWQVVVHNDPVNLMSYVTMVFQRVFGYPRDKAEKHMLEVHQKGRSILWSGMRERGELYVQQLHGYLLLATLEKIS